MIKEKTPTHKSRAFEYLVKHGSITTKQAIDELGNTRLADSIWRLRHEGHNITTTMIEVPNRFGAIVKVAKYTLIPDEILRGIMDGIRMFDNESVTIGKEVKDGI